MIEETKLIEENNMTSFKIFLSKYITDDNRIYIDLNGKIDFFEFKANSNFKCNFDILQDVILRTVVVNRNINVIFIDNLTQEHGQFCNDLLFQLSKVINNTNLIKIVFNGFIKHIMLASFPIERYVDILINSATCVKLLNNSIVEYESIVIRSFNGFNMAFSNNICVSYGNYYGEVHCEIGSYEDLFSSKFEDFVKKYVNDKKHIYDFMLDYYVLEEQDELCLKLTNHTKDNILFIEILFAFICKFEIKHVIFMNVENDRFVEELLYLISIEGNYVTNIHYDDINRVIVYSGVNDNLIFSFTHKNPKIIIKEKLYNVQICGSKDIHTNDIDNFILFDENGILYVVRNGNYALLSEYDFEDIKYLLNDNFNNVIDTLYNNLPKII